jgi:hypothetical protein
MLHRQLCLCLTVLSSTAACGDDQGTDTTDDTGSTSAVATDTATPTTSTGDSSTGDSSTGDSSTGDGSTGEPLDNPFPAGGCGLPEYPILPATDMGEVLDHAFVINFKPETINLLLEGQGFGALTPVAYGADVYKIRYRTQDRGEAVEATGFVSYPTGDKVGERPVVVYAHGTTGFTDKCGPTAAADGYVIPALLAALGFVTVAPDYLGMNGWGAPSGFLHPYVVPEPTAIATLDSLRALVRFAGDTGETPPASPGKDIILFGISEGGFATLWADRYAPLYAPEFKLLANVASVPPTDAFGLTKHGATVFGPTTGALAAAIVGSHAWYRLDTPLSEVLSDAPPNNVAELLPKLMAEDCSADVPADITMTNQVYQQSFIDAISVDDVEALGPVGCILNKASIGTSDLPFTVFTPTLVVQGETDDLVYTPVVRDDLPDLCDQGYILEHYECAGAGHVDAATQSIPYVIAWVNDRVAGKPLADPCVIHDAVDCAPPMP